jgi:hypothetical protein
MESELLRNIQKAEEESRATGEIIRKLIKLRILERGPYGSWGFYKPRKNRQGKWEWTFVPVVVEITSDGLVIWARDIADPAKLLSTLITRYREKNRRVREQVEKVSEAEPPWYAVPDP